MGQLELTQALTVLACTSESSRALTTMILNPKHVNPKHVSPKHVTRRKHGQVKPE